MDLFNLLNVFIKIENSFFLLNCKTYLSKLQNVFIQIASCIFTDCEMYLSKECCSLRMEASTVDASQLSVNTALSALCMAVCSAEQQKQFTSLSDSILCIAMQHSAIFYSALAKVLKNVHCAGQSIGRLAFGWPGSMKLFGPIALLIGLRPVIQFQHKYF